jgi:3-oxoacyl-[acyl-carrier protein] reductase
MDLGLKNKKALVWGASQGIGYAIAESLVKEGAIVTIASRSTDKIKSAKDKLNADHAITLDLTKSGEAKESIQKATELMNGLDILIINTGGPAKNNFEDVTGDQWQIDFQNLWLSATDGIKEVLPEMKKNCFGRIVLVSSIAAREPLPGLTTSNGFRAGLAGLFKSISSEVASHGITLNIACPGYTNTERIQALSLNKETIKQLVPAGRLGEPNELADLVSFLSSERAAYITGQQISVDGGSNKGIY